MVKHSDISRIAPAFLSWSCGTVWMRENIDRCTILCSQPLPEPRRSKAAEVTKEVVIISREKLQQQQQQAMREVSKTNMVGFHPDVY
jgi:hypothetical protein